MSNTQNTQAETSPVALYGTIRAASEVTSQKGKPYLTGMVEVRGLDKKFVVLNAHVDAMRGKLAVGSEIRLLGNYEGNDPAKGFQAIGTAEPDVADAAPPQATRPKAAKAAGTTTADAAKPAPASQAEPAPQAANDDAAKDQTYAYVGTVSDIRTGTTKAKEPKPYATFRFTYRQADGTMRTRTTNAFGKGYENIRPQLVDGGQISIRVKFDKGSNGATFVALALQERKAA